MPISFRKIIAKELERGTGLNPHYRNTSIALSRTDHTLFAFIQVDVKKSKAFKVWVPIGLDRKGPGNRFFAVENEL